jgi:zinc transport system ATP-binding protein
VQPAVELKDVSFAYPGGPEVLSGVDLGIRRGEFVTIAGPNGGGKTTLLRIALGLEEPDTGEARLFSEPADRVRDRYRIGYLAQRTRLAIDAPATVSEVVAAGRVARRGLLKPFGRGDRDAIADAISRVGLEDQAATPIQRLSGGQQQRAFIAKALAGEPELLVLDEPTAGVDVDAQEAFGAFLGELHEALGVTILYVSHEFGAVERFVERVILVRGGVGFDGPPAELPAHWHDPSHVHP